MFSALLAVVALGTGFPWPGAGHPREASERERRERLEKLLAEVDASEEKSEWSKKQRETIAVLVRVLDQAEQVEYFRVNPRRAGTSKEERAKGFHGHAILASGQVGSAAARKEVAGFLGRTLHWNDLRMKACFDPGYALRATAGKRTVDFLICFACNRVDVFEGDEPIATVALGLVDADNPIARVVRAAEKKGAGDK